jgi:hypothetical protein
MQDIPRDPIAQVNGKFARRGSCPRGPVQMQIAQRGSEVNPDEKSELQESARCALSNWICKLLVARCMLFVGVPTNNTPHATCHKQIRAYGVS